MQTVQLTLENSAYRTALETALFETGSWQVVPVAAPDLERSGVIVVDAPALDRLAGLLAAPERVVLIARKDPKSLSRAWEAGIISVVFEDESVSTALLAIMSAGLRIHSRASTPGAPAAGGEAGPPCPSKCNSKPSGPRGEEVQ